MTCVHCNDTGSLSKDIDGFLDCTHCDVAAERVMVEHWAREHAPDCPSWDLWPIYLQGRKAANARLLHVVQMVRDADNDAQRDGLPRIPAAARAAIDAAIASVTE